MYNIMKPRIFIGSSKESLGVAKRVKTFFQMILIAIFGLMTSLRATSHLSKHL